MTGKLADTVMAVRNGEQLARKYQPVVFNPSTAAQVAQRAKLKLLSQLSAVVGSYIAMPRKGNVSARNLFTKVNFPSVSYSAADGATIGLEGLKLTSSSVYFPQPIVEATEYVLNASIPASETPYDFDAVVYVEMQVTSDNKVRVVSSQVVDTPGAENRFQGSLALTDTESVVLAYGIKMNETARTIYGNLTGVIATEIAKLVANRTLSESNSSLTDTASVKFIPGGEG